MPRSIDDQPGDLPGEGETEVPRAVRYLVDGYPGHVLGWVDTEPPIVRVTPDAWQTIANTASEEGELKNISVISMKAGAVSLRALAGIGTDADAAFVVCSFPTDGTGRSAIKVSL